jgi:type 1 fimbria pilin
MNLLPCVVTGLLGTTVSFAAGALPLQIRGELVTSTCEVQARHPALAVLTGRVDPAVVNGNARAGRKDFSVFLACPASGGDPPLDIWIDGLRHVGVAISDAQGTPWPIGESGGRWLRVQRSPQTRVDVTAWHASPVGDATAGTAAASVELVVAYP